MKQGEPDREVDRKWICGIVDAMEQATKNKMYRVKLVLTSSAHPQVVERRLRRQKATRMFINHAHPMGVVVGGVVQKWRIPRLYEIPGVKQVLYVEDV